MKELLSRLSSYETRDLVSTLFLLFVLLFIPHTINKLWFISFPLVFIAGFILFYFRFSKYKLVFWGSITALLVLECLTFYYVSANHLFVMIYFSLTLMISHYFHHDQEYLAKTSAILLFIIMFVGGLQKILSENFMNGSFLMDLFVLGQLFEVTKLIPSFYEYFSENKDIIFEAYRNFDDSPEAQMQTLFPGQLLFIQVLTWTVFLSELLFALLFFVKNERIKQTYFLLFLFFILLTRIETGFIAVLSLLLLSQLPKEKFEIYRFAYILIYLVCMSMIVSKLGLY